MTREGGAHAVDVSRCGAFADQAGRSGKDARRVVKRKTGRDCDPVKHLSDAAFLHSTDLTCKSSPRSPSVEICLQQLAQSLAGVALACLKPGYVSARNAKPLGHLRLREAEGLAGGFEVSGGHPTHLIASSTL